MTHENSPSRSWNSLRRSDPASASRQGSPLDVPQLATPAVNNGLDSGPMIDHLEDTKGFNLRALKYLVMDEADRILNMDFESEVDKILKVIPRDRHTFLFSATMTKKVQKLQWAALRDPVKCAVSTKYSTIEKLQQYYIFIPSKYKNKRLGALNKFKSESHSVLLATDVTSRSLNIPHVDCAINFDIPTHSKVHTHSLTQRYTLTHSKVHTHSLKGTHSLTHSLKGTHTHTLTHSLTITFIVSAEQHEQADLANPSRLSCSQSLVLFVYDVELFQRIEVLIGKKLPSFPTQEEEVMMLMERVSEAQRFAHIEMNNERNGKDQKQERKRLMTASSRAA
ncbi:probable ATP-dependent RNA helicase DDX47 [Myxocyprinus asiaticus]|uniref:probable ATP-dependent RNA helicase DDX47 n=1 Tax=Myxocyprinus asiaticus TaxID=70543 RepID=UPI0022216D26|nr:probable ATP-dependent RNA helicase DDX47 [Myxocyprinus asiaticus]